MFRDMSSQIALCCLLHCSSNCFVLVDDAKNTCKKASQFAVVDFTLPLQLHCGGLLQQFHVILLINSVTQG